MIKYDDASWHYGGKFPEGLPTSAGATHIGMFTVWCVLNDLGGEDVEDLAEDIAELEARTLTPGAFVIQALDEKLIGDDLSREGNAFAIAYYVGKDNDSRFLDDYFAEFDVDDVNCYRVPDTWDTYDRIAEKITTRFETWEAAGRPEFIV